VLWEALRNRRLAGARFRRQHTIDGFIADFVCIDAELVIEVDGTIHDDTDQRDYDAQRQRWIESRGFSVLRFRNHEVETDLDKVLDAIRTWFAARTTRTGNS